MSRHANLEKLDRRRFLAGSGGAVLALPMLELFAPRMARGATLAPPKRLVIVSHGNGRLIGAARKWDQWSPGTASGPLPTSALSPMLAGLGPIRDEIVTVDGVDNVLRCAIYGDGHVTSAVTMLTGQMPNANTDATGPSLDYIAGTRLRPDASMRASVVLPASATPVGVYYQNPLFWGQSGTGPTILSGNPDQSVGELFGSLMPGTAPPPTPTFRDRLQTSRRSLLDNVTGALTSLRGRLGARDRDRLDLHTQFIRSLETRVSGGGSTVATASCARPDAAQLPHVPTSTWDEYVAAGGPDPAYVRDLADGITTSYQIENLVMALACDVVRVGVLGLCDDPVWRPEFGGASPYEESNAVHGDVHGIQAIETAADSQRASNLTRGFQHFTGQFTQLIQRLAAVQDVDGSRLLDNTLVLWVSELGYASDHLSYNIPIVLAGMRGEFSKGQGRHLSHEAAPRTMGDLCAQVLRMLGGADTTFGETGTLAQVAAAHGSTMDTSPGRPGTSGASPLHAGALDL